MGSPYFRADLFQREKGYAYTSKQQRAGQIVEEFTNQFEGSSRGFPNPPNRDIC
ncbi:hypothetical protein BDY24DRAFT_403164 [Mrakia frigida]|uniref:uncharacterized protein n=1 Tax=Mrakia frigida TaxID=29902 RepID=UPI003FCBEFB2